MKILQCAFLLASLASVWTPAEGRAVTCTNDDKQYMFTPCNTETNTMQSIQYYAKACSRNSAPLDAPTTVPCYIDCKDGEFYSAKAFGCDKCPAGSSSRSDSVNFYNFRELPDYATTFCYPQPCNAWTAENEGGNVFSSGNQTGLAKRNSWGAVDETVDSSFVILTDIVDRRGGGVKFSYRVESEKSFDGLIVYVDGQMQKNPETEVTGNSRFWATGMHYQWRTGVVEIPYGKHEVKFAFTKDTNQMSDGGLEVGDDRAYLKDVTLIGVQTFAAACELCPAGSFASLAGSPKCVPCDENTYAKAGATQCTPCNGDEWAPPGSSACHKKLPCVKEDYVAMYGKCDTKSRTRVRMWDLVNTRCIVDSSTAPHSGESVPCSDCMPGTLLDLKTGVCSKCPEGHALSSATGACEPCAPTTAALTVWDYSDGFDQFGGEFPSNFATQSCTGRCIDCSQTNRGANNCFFELASYPQRDSDGTVVGIRQSQYMGTFYTATMTIPIELDSDGSIEVEYAFVHSTADPTVQIDVPVPDELTAMITINRVEYPLSPIYTSTTKRVGRITNTLPAGKHDIKFTVDQSGFVDFDDRFDVVILGIKVIGELRGGNPTCTRCSAGHYCPGKTSKFLPCQPGSYAYGEGKERCDACSDGFAQKDTAARWCNYCPSGTYANANKTLCVNTCNITTWAGSWDLTPLRGKIFGPLTKSNIGDGTGSGSSSGTSTNSGSASTYNQLPDTSVLDRLNVDRFYVSPCSFVNENKAADRTCTINRDTGVVDDAYACMRVNQNFSYSLGDEVSYSTYGGKLVQYLASGDKCQHADMARRSNITYICDPNDDPGTLTFVNEQPQCQYNFAFNSRYGCPVCTVDSFEKVVGDCGTDGYKRTAYFKKSASANCFGGYVPPAEVKETCRFCDKHDFEIVWSDCVAGKQKATFELKSASLGCIDNRESQLLRVTEQESILPRECRKIDATIGTNSFTVGLVFIIVGVGLAGGAAYVFYKRHADLSVKYQRLNNYNGGTLEMADHDDFGQDEDDDDDNNGTDFNNTPAPGASAPSATATEDV